MQGDLQTGSSVFMYSRHAQSDTWPSRLGHGVPRAGGGFTPHSTYGAVLQMGDGAEILARSHGRTLAEDAPLMAQNKSKSSATTSAIDCRATEAVKV